MIADCLEQLLVEAGYDVCGIATNGLEATHLGQQHRPDLAVIDLRLGGGDYGTEVAAELRHNGPVGILYATGNPENQLLLEAEGEGCISKPYLPSSILTALRIVGARMAMHPTQAAHPAGFRLLG